MAFSFQTLSASESNESKESHQPTFLIHPVSVVVERGKESDVIAEAVPHYGDEVVFEVSRFPKFGSLQKIGKTHSSQIFHYVSNPKFTSGQDSFEFRVKAPRHAWNTYTAELRITNPPGILLVMPSNLNFENVPIGTIATKNLVLSNSFGAPVTGTLLLPAPWKFSGDGSFSLSEGESQTFSVEFSPNTVAESSAELAIVPEIAHAPSAHFSGTGVPPFLLTSTSSIVSTENPTARFAVTNNSLQPMPIAWAENEKLLLSPPIVIPPKEVGEMSLSIAHLKIPVEGLRTLHPVLQAGSFSQQLEVVAHGPKGIVSLEALQESQLPTATIGRQQLLNGILHNTSSSTRIVSLLLSSGPKITETPDAVQNTISLGAGQSIPFSLPWTPLAAGLSMPSVHVIESNNDLCSAVWKFSVVSPQASQPPPASLRPIDIFSSTGHSTPELRPTSSVTLASQKEKQSLVTLLPPHFEDGLFMRSLILRWRFFGAENTGFVIQEHRLGNALSERGEVDSDHWYELPLKTHPQKTDAIGAWQLKLTMPFPGIHEYRIFPDGPGDKIVCSMKVEITWMMYLWPILRISLVIIGILILIKFIRYWNSR